MAYRSISVRSNAPSSSSSAPPCPFPDPAAGGEAERVGEITAPAEAAQRLLDCREAGGFECRSGRDRRELEAAQDLGGVRRLLGLRRHLLFLHRAVFLGLLVLLRRFVVRAEQLHLLKSALVFLRPEEQQATEKDESDVQQHCTRCRWSDSWLFLVGVDADLGDADLADFVEHADHIAEIRAGIAVDDDLGILGRGLEGLQFQR